jgi:hypothetical protein
VSTRPRDYNWGATCLEIREYGRRHPSRWPRGAHYPQKSALTLLTSSGRSVGIVRSRTQATEFSFRCDVYHCPRGWHHDKLEQTRHSVSADSNLCSPCKRSRSAVLRLLSRAAPWQGVSHHLSSRMSPNPVQYVICPDYNFAWAFQRRLELELECL